ncbi:MAG: PEP-CTERM sorting domain-containing protein [Planctomycetota bacterium]
MRLSTCALLTAALAAPAAAQPTNFFVHANENQGFSDSRRSVTFYDADAIGDLALFSVYIGFEESVGNNEEISAIDVDPVTGDVYVLGFDSGTTGTVVTGTGGVADDTEGDFDLYRIDFDTVFSYWTDNFQGEDARSVTGIPATVDPFSANPAGPNSGNADYVTFSTGPGAFPFQLSHSNAVNLPGAVTKIGEVNRNQASDFFKFSLEYIDDDTLLVLDNAEDTLDQASTDHGFRVIERQDTVSGTGDFSSGTAESWTSREIAKVNLDFDTNTSLPVGNSEAESTAYYDNGNGVRGVWVTESDGGGDDIAFLQLDANNNSLGYRAATTGFDSFALDDDPFTLANTNDGQADNIFVDSNGNLIIIESGFGDPDDGGGAPGVEPSIITREVLDYDDNGQILFGDWGEKKVIDPVKDNGVGFLERGAWSIYDEANNAVIFISPDTGNFFADIFVYDLDDDTTTTFTDVDDSVSLFFGDSFGDFTDAFSLTAVAGLVGDFDDDGQVAQGDLNQVLNNWGGTRTFEDSAGTVFTTASVDQEELNAVLNNWGSSAAPSFEGSAVPEPATAAALGLLALAGLRRRSA